VSSDGQAVQECTLEQLAEVFDEVVDLSGVQVHEGAVLGDHIPLDSRDMLRVLSRIESRYRIRFAPTDVLRMRTLGDVLTAVRGRTHA